MSLDFKTLTFPEPLGPPRPVAGDFYLYFCNILTNSFQKTEGCFKRNERFPPLLYDRYVALRLICL